VLDELVSSSDPGSFSMMEGPELGAVLTVRETVLAIGRSGILDNVDEGVAGLA